MNSTQRQFQTAAYTQVCIYRFFCREHTLIKRWHCGCFALRWFDYLMRYSLILRLRLQSIVIVVAMNTENFNASLNWVVSFWLGECKNSWVNKRPKALRILTYMKKGLVVLDGKSDHWRRVLLSAGFSFPVFLRCLRQRTYVHVCTIIQHLWRIIKI